MKTSVIILWLCVVLVILALIAPRVWSEDYEIQLDSEDLKRMKFTTDGRLGHELQDPGALTPEDRKFLVERTETRDSHSVPQVEWIRVPSEKWVQTYPTYKNKVITPKYPVTIEDPFPEPKPSAPWQIRSVPTKYGVVTRSMEKYITPFREIRYDYSIKTYDTLVEALSSMEDKEWWFEVYEMRQIHVEKDHAKKEVPVIKWRRVR